MSEDRITSAITQLRGALRALNANSKKDPIRALRHTLNARELAAGATHLIHEEAVQLKLLVIREVENADEKTTDPVID